MRLQQTLSRSLFILFLLLWPACAPEDFQAGVNAYNQGDYETAFKLWLPLAEQGEAEAQYYLGGLYFKGEGVPQDYVQAREWWLKAAEQGNAMAQNTLGVMYAEGEGVSQDDEEAARWYRRAAEQGDAKAQHNLGVRYDTGQGVPQDDVQAHMWVGLADAQGDELARRARDRLAKRMTPAQLDEALRLAREWQPTVKSDTHSKFRLLVPQ